MSSSTIHEEASNSTKYISILDLNMTATKAEQRAVFLAYQGVVTQSHTEKKLKQLKKFVDKHKSTAGRSVEQLPTEKIASIIQFLLQKGIFQSHKKAMVEFPELFGSAPSSSKATIPVPKGKSVEKAKDEASKGKAPVTICKKSDFCSSGSSGSSSLAAGVPAGVPAGLPAVETAKVTGKATVAAAAPPVIALDPPQTSILPFASQYIILSKCQQLLEECCFDFAAKRIPSLLEGQGWHTPEAGELTVWWSTLSRYGVPSDAVDIPSGLTLHTMFNDMKELRNAAVHRESISTARIKKFMAASISITTAFRDTQRTERLRSLLDTLEQLANPLEVQRDQLRKTLDTQLAALRDEEAALKQKMAALQVKATSAMAEMRTEEDKICVTFTSLFRRCSEHIFASDSEIYGRYISGQFRPPYPPAHIWQASLQEDTSMDDCEGGGVSLGHETDSKAEKSTEDYATQLAASAAKKGFTDLGQWAWIPNTWGWL
jgi:hypothetical protein